MENPHQIPDNTMSSSQPSLQDLQAILGAAALGRPQEGSQLKDSSTGGLSNSLGDGFGQGNESLAYPANVDLWPARAAESQRTIRRQYWDVLEMLDVNPGSLAPLLRLIMMCLK